MILIDEKTLCQIHDIELEILKEFIKCCNRLNLKYYLLGGSILGAIRHQGFIPWDDDIDVGMFRKDYEIFLTEAPKILPSYFFVQCLDTEPEQLFNFAKIRDSRTTFIETSYGKSKVNHGVYIDIFPLDYYPEDPRLQKKIDRTTKTLSLRIRKEFNIPVESRQSFFKEFTLNLIGTLLSIKYSNVRDAILDREKLYKSIPRSSLVANYNGAWGKKEIMPITWYGDGTVATFEGLKVVLPKEYDKWLTQVYGDYMELPPESKRIPHHYVDVIDLEKPYTEYIKRF